MGSLLLPLAAVAAGVAPSISGCAPPMAQDYLCCVQAPASSEPAGGWGHRQVPGFIAVVVAGGWKELFISRPVAFRLGWHPA